ncbi:DUF998 domain-containing protein [Microbacterium sp. Bi121]|uniref:DUF998 domain-containing protein n=1 Tax=Microbacterium sp. Bi121 TaxID=2822348 RepID=UPI001D809048|nr:DUF998 domain-containing protein [Microbacterium sp. Bi121]CAH0127189.1 hypothetical protein SRABI121_00651 [Microbacterium sp. Bi121]
MATRAASLWHDLVRRSRAGSLSLETTALLVGAAFFSVGFVVSLPPFWGRELDIAGAWSIGAYAAVGGAVVAILSVLLGRVVVRRGRIAAQADGLTMRDDRLRWYDTAAITLAYAATALLGWSGIAALLELSFADAPVYDFPGAILVAVAFALTAYVCFLSAASLTPMMLSLVLAIFLVVGAFASMLTATDRHWWRDNLSALGMASNDSAWIFNGTLIVAGVIVTTVSRYATAGLPVADPQQKRGRHYIRIGMILMGIFLTCVGVFPVDAFFIVHNTVATGMAVAFAAVVIALPWLLPSISSVFVGMGYVYVAVIVLLGIFFATGYYNLTAVELIAAILIFSWIIVFLRAADDVQSQPATENAVERQPAV